MESSSTGRAHARGCVHCLAITLVPLATSGTYGYTTVDNIRNSKSLWRFLATIEVVDLCYRV